MGSTSTSFAWFAWFADAWADSSIHSNYTAGVCIVRNIWVFMYFSYTLCVIKSMFYLFIVMLMLTSLGRLDRWLFKVHCDPKRVVSLWQPRATNRLKICVQNQNCTAVQLKSSPLRTASRSVINPLFQSTLILPTSNQRQLFSKQQNVPETFGNVFSTEVYRVSQKYTVWEQRNAISCMITDIILKGF